jgi:gluconate 2-dehydrogenase gamma chain
MSDLTRREALGRLAAAFAGAAAIDQAAARDAHAWLQQTAGSRAYSPAGLPAPHFKTLEQLTDLIIPVDNGKPGALAAGVPAWIDSLLNVNAELRARYVEGLTWIDATMMSRHGRDFVSAAAGERTALLDQIAFRKNASLELDAGIEFFVLLRRMTVDGFYTSDAGIRDINPGGRPPVPVFVVPQESIDYVISRSPFK